MKSYAGIGSRNTPDDVLNLMRRAAAALASQGYLLRSGAAQGADSAFEQGAIDRQGAMQIFLPWDGFSERTADGKRYRLDLQSADRLESAMKILEQGAYPAIRKVKQSVQKLHCRNVLQVLGPELNDPVKFVLCWTPDGAQGRDDYRQGVTGGTGTAIKLAASLGIPVFNIQRPAQRLRIENFLGLTPSTPVVGGQAQLSL